MRELNSLHASYLLQACMQVLINSLGCRQVGFCVCVCVYLHHFYIYIYPIPPQPVLTYHFGDGSWSLSTQCLQHLKDVHCSLYLAALNGIRHRAEDSRTSHSITTKGREGGSNKIRNNYKSLNPDFEPKIILVNKF